MAQFVYDARIVMDDPSDLDPIYGSFEFGVGLYTDKDTAIDGMIGYVHDGRWGEEEANALEKAIKERRDSLFKHSYCESFQMDTRTRPNGPKRPMDYDFYLEERQLYSTPDWDK